MQNKLHFTSNVVPHRGNSEENCQMFDDITSIAGGLVVIWKTVISRVIVIVFPSLTTLTTDCRPFLSSSLAWMHRPTESAQSAQRLVPIGREPAERLTSWAIALSPAA